MKYVGKLKHEPGWCGGKWFLNEKELVTASSGWFVKLNEGFYKLKAKEVHGEDYDHGHRDKWTNIDFVINVATPAGKVSVSLKDQGFKSLEVYTK